jgi:hypothetical protein
VRRTVFLVLGVLEFAVAAVLVSLGWQLPATAEVQQGFEHAGQVTRRAGEQVRMSRQQVHDLRRPEVQQLAERLRSHTQVVTRDLRARSIDYDKVEGMRDALGKAADGLDGAAKGVDAMPVADLRDGLGDLASYLDKGVIPTAEKSADDLDQSVKGLRDDARHLEELLRTATPDLQAAREVHASLARFGEGLDRMKRSLQLRRLDRMREGFRGLETALSTGAGQVERIADYTYPEVRMRGLRPDVTMKPFWPEGGEIAKGLRKAADGVAAAGKELDDMSVDLPKMMESLDESRRLVDKTRDTLGTALRQQEKLEPVLKAMPDRAARLAVTLPRLGEDLARLLRGTGRLRDLATMLRKTQKTFDLAIARGPELRDGLAGTAGLLRATRDQLDLVLRNREQYEAAMGESIRLAETLSTLLPLLAEQLSTHLQEQERGLNDLEKSIGEVSGALPAYEQTTVRLLRMGRILAWLVAVAVGLHGAYLVASARPTPLAA